MVQIRGKRTYAVIIGWVAYRILKSQGIIVPHEIFGPLVDCAVDVLFGAGAVLFRWLARAPQGRRSRRKKAVGEKKY